MTAAISGTTASTALGGGSTATTARATGGVMGKDDFMKLLITQMTNQDPLSPQDSAQMASQLAQFSALEQMTNINAALQSQSAGTAAMLGAVNNSSALALIGKSVTAVTDQVAGGPAGTTAVSADVPVGGGQLSVRLIDANGVTVETKDLGAVSGGQVPVEIGDLTKNLPGGAYTVTLDLTDSAGVVTHPASTVTAKIDGVRFGTNGAVVTSGFLTFPIGFITSVQ
ncbi:MAG: flagellar hook assembly protein FlgD [Gemmatimonadaceae bacterium]